MVVTVLVEVGVRVWVAESVTVPGTRVVVMVLVVDGVGMLRQEQALEMAEAAQLDGKQVGFCTAPRFWFAAVVVAVYAVLKQESVTVDVVRVTVAVSVSVTVSETWRSVVVVSVAVEVVMYGSPVTVAVVVTWTLVGVTVAVVEKVLVLIER